ncbi:MAG: hypothetical protein ACTSUC_09770 [Promethearchaeota archaeon]
MVFTNYGKERIAFLLGSELDNTYIRYYGIGNGSGMVAVTNSELISEDARFEITGSPDFTTSKKVTFTGDYNSIDFSGLSLQEFGLFSESGTNFPGSTWYRQQLIGSVVGTGDIEIRLETTFEVI